MGGFNTIDAGSNMPPTDCVYVYNMVGGDMGLRVRLGYRDHCTHLTGVEDNTVRTIIPYTGSTRSGSNNKLFAATSSGIWDCSARGAVSSAYAAATAYALKDHVTSGSTTWACIDAGTSDLTSLPSVWAVATAYVTGDRVVSDNSVYICDTNGTSGDGTGGTQGPPTGTSNNQVDGTARWDYVGPSTAFVDTIGSVTWKHMPDNVVPTLVYAFPSTAGDAGRGVFTVVVTSAGHFLLYADEENGLIQYTESTNTWAASAITGITGGVGSVCFVTVFKGRVWMVEKDTTRAWYLTTGAITGAATVFNMAQRFKAGGTLVGLWSWTYDGGSGLDDSLVAISQGGDVAVYQGIDPSSATTFGLVGVWQVGSVPAGRRIATDMGGDLLLMTGSGVLTMSKLVVGGAEIAEQQATTYKIATLFNELAINYRGNKNWSIQLHPTENALIVCVPSAGDSDNTEQLAMSTAQAKGWSRYRRLPVYSMGVFEGDMYFGTANGRVCKSIDFLDDVPLTAETFTAISWSLLTAFRNNGDATVKQVQSIRPVVMSRQASPPVTAAARYDFNLTEPDEPSGSGSGGPSAWDEAIWDTSVWGGDYTTYAPILGATGLGRSVAVAVRGKAATRTVLVGVDVHYTTGGPV